MTYNPQPLFDIICEHGEGPVFDSNRQCLYWVDMLKGHLIIGNMANLNTQKFSIGKALGVLALRKSGGLVLAAENDFIHFDFQNNSLSPIASVPKHKDHATRFNDGAIDQKGRLFAGTMTWDGATDIGTLYRLNADLTAAPLEQGLHIPNGMGWSIDNRTFFLTDTHRHVIYAYDYSLESGEITNKRAHIQFKDDEFPDGMAIDTNGHLWIAFWGGSKVGHFNAAGKHIKDIKLPVPHCTSCCFGGDDMTTLFVTTSQLILSDAEKKRYPLAGRTFSVQTDSVGREAALFAG